MSTSMSVHEVLIWLMQSFRGRRLRVRDGSVGQDEGNPGVSELVEVEYNGEDAPPTDLQVLPTFTDEETEQLQEAKAGVDAKREALDLDTLGPMGPL